MGGNPSRDELKVDCLLVKQANKDHRPLILGKVIARSRHKLFSALSRQASISMWPVPI
jgi:hypothetical protein